MIQDFIGSWELFGNVYLVGWLIAAMLGLIGVLVVARNQIFIGAALSQASMLGIAIAMWGGAVIGGRVGELSESDVVLTAVAVIFAVLAALFTGRSRSSRRETREAITGWIFLLGASGSIIVVSHSPLGLDEVQRLLSSSIIGATRLDLAVFGAMTAMTVGAIARWWRPLLLWVMDPATAEAAGVRIALVELIAALWLGLSVGVCIRASGMLYTFGCLVLPALLARAICREVRAMLIVSPLIGLAGSAGGFMVANHYDYPMGQLSIAMLCVATLLGWVWRAIRS